MRIITNYTNSHLICHMELLELENYTRKEYDSDKDEQDAKQALQNIMNSVTDKNKTDANPQKIKIEVLISNYTLDHTFISRDAAKELHK